MFKYILNIYLLFFIISCQTPHIPKTQQEKLYHMLISLDTHISHKQAYNLSKELISVSNQLKHKYNPIIEPHFNNLLVNIGIKEHGLCYEWSDMLYLHFKPKESIYRDFEFHLLVSNQGQYWSEHNAFAISLKHHNIYDGLVIDLWRDIDSIYINKIKNDKIYTWVYRKSREF